MSADQQPTYGNWQRPVRPGIGSLGLAGTAGLLVGLVVSLLMTMFSLQAGVVTAVVFAAAIGPLAIRGRDGRAAFTAMASRIGWWRRRSVGATSYVSGPLSQRPGGQFQPPGLLARRQMHEGRDAYDRPFGLLHHPGLNTWTLAFQCDPDGGSLVDADQVNAWVAQWGGWLAGLAHEPGLAGAAVIVETAPDPGSRLAAEVLPRLAPDAPRLARTVMEEVVATYPAASSETSAYVTLTYGPSAARREVADTITELATRIPGLAAGLVAAGAGAASPMSAERIAETIRVAYDPQVAATVLAARADGTPTGQTWNNAGPADAEELRDHYIHDSGVSRSWEAVEAPRGAVRSSVLRALLEPSARIRRKRVAIVYRPLSPASAARIVERERRNAYFMTSSTRGPIRARAAGTVRAAEQTAAEEAEGAGLVEFGVYVTATVDRVEDLDVAEAEITNLAATARLHLRPARRQQANCFAVALPAGVLPWQHTAVPDELRSLL